MAGVNNLNVKEIATDTDYIYHLKIIPFVLSLLQNHLETEI